MELRIFFLVSDAKLACEEFLILPNVLRNLLIDGSTPLELNKETISEVDFGTIGNQTRKQNGSLRRLMIEILEGVKGSHYKDGQEYSQKSAKKSRDSPLINYIEVSSVLDPRPEPSLRKAKSYTYTSENYFRPIYAGVGDLSQAKGGVSIHEMCKGYMTTSKPERDHSCISSYARCSGCARLLLTLRNWLPCWWNLWNRCTTPQRSESSTEVQACC